MKTPKNDKVDIGRVIDKMVEDKKFIAKMIQQGRKNELKGKFKFANPV